jgi:hypothetical protein
MSTKPSSPDRRQVLAASATVAASSLIPMQAQAATSSDAIRPFRVTTSASRRSGCDPSPVPAMVAGYEHVPFVFMPGKKVGGPASILT